MRFAVCCLFAFALLTFQSAAFAETSVAVVDVKRLMRQSEAAQSIDRQSDALRAQYLAKISKREQALRALEQSIMEQSKSLSEEELVAKRQGYEAQLLETRKFAQDMKRALEQAAAQANENLRSALYMVVQDLADENGYDLVISNQNVITGKTSLDITLQALERLNEKVSEIPLALEEP